ncbi:MAG TPA: hypothetical protein VNJ02_07325 [Vicinamibacterales bacterium]|nr:hypothetical protein [Vicinamibacterales bacterium]
MRSSMNDSIVSRVDLYHGLFRWESVSGGAAALSRHSAAPTSIPDPHGRVLKVATVDAKARGICPACASTGQGGYVSFVQDLRLAYACPSCQKLVWLNGA